MRKQHSKLDIWKSFQARVLRTAPIQAEAQARGYPFLAAIPSAQYKDNRDRLETRLSQIERLLMAEQTRQNHWTALDRWRTQLPKNASDELMHLIGLFEARMQERSLADWLTITQTALAQAQPRLHGEDSLYAKVYLDGGTKFVFWRCLNDLQTNARHYSVKQTRVALPLSLKPWDVLHSTCQACGNLFSLAILPEDLPQTAWPLIDQTPDLLDSVTRC